MRSGSGYSRGAVKPADKASGGWKRWAGVLAGLLLLGFGIAWGGGWIRFTTDPRVLEIKKMQADMQAKFMANGGPTTEAEAKAFVAAMGQVREKREELPQELRRQADAGGRQAFQNAMRQNMNAYFQAAPSERKAVLMQQIKQQEMMRKAFAAAGGGRGWPGGGQNTGAGGGGPGAGGQNAGAAGGAPGGGGGQNTGAGGGGPGGGGRGGPGGGQNAGGGGGGLGGGGWGGPGGGGQNAGGGNQGGTGTDWRKRIIDNTTPTQRAQYTEYRRVMDETRAKMGLPPGGRGGR